MLYKKKVLKLVFSKPIDFSSKKLFIDHISLICVNIKH